MIKSITICDVASYDHEGVTFSNLKKVNFIYGGNGTGKTTLSRVLNEVERYPQCQIKWENRVHDVVVYNQDFKRNTLTETIPGVFTMGPSSYSYWSQRSRMAKLRREMERRPYDELAQRELEQTLDEELQEEMRFSVEPAVLRINRKLEEIGFTGFKIRQSEKKPYSYQIVRRNGAKAGETLSEGEVTIITFLYFLQTLEPKVAGGNPNRNKVVVVDDPICSLDYDTIEVVSTFTNQLAERAEQGRDKVNQLMVLTHNAEFIQNLSVRQPLGSTHYWKLYKTQGVSHLTDCGTENPVHGDYEGLWLRLREASRQNNSLVMPNLMRRIVETYFVDFGRFNKRELFAGLYVDNPTERKELVAIAQNIDEGSHGVCGNLFAGNEEMFCESCMDNLCRFFTLMGQSEHYNMMMRL